jgi:mono/diheme cytochrome c family protein
MRVAMIAFATAFAAPMTAMAAEDVPATANPQELAVGAQVYAKNCASCHGADLEGQPNWRQRNDNGRMPAPPHNVRGHTWHHDDATLFGITKLGTAEFTGLDIESDMPAFKDVLSDAEIWAVLAYIKSRWPARIRRRQESINRRAAN